MLQRLHLSRPALGLLLLATTAVSAAAQQGRVRGIIMDETQQPIKGATVIAENPNNFGPPSVTATTDDKGRFSMIGLRLGQWRLIAHAPGYGPQGGNVTVRPIAAGGAPVAITLRRTGPATTGVLANISARELQDQLAAADALFAQKNWDDAIMTYRAVLARAPSLTSVYLKIAAAYRGKNDYDRAIAAYNSELAADPGNGTSHVEIARMHLERGDARMAEETLLKAAAAETAGREVFYALGDLTLARGEANDASGWFTKAAGADPDWGKPRYRLGELALSGGDKQRAVQLMDEVIAVDPRSPEAALARAALDQMNSK